jgi:predicted metal-dependent peptidase
MLSEDEDKDDSQLTDDEKREKLRKDYEEKRRKRRRSQSSGRAEEFHRMSPRDEGDRRQNHDPSGMKREIDDLKSLSSLKMEDIDINDYLDSQIAHNAHMTDRLKNTLNNLDKSISKPKIYSGVISENNSSEGEK